MRRLVCGALLAAALGGPAAAALALPAAAAEQTDLASMVDTRDGSLGAGFPMVSAAAPFGMIEAGPDTALADGQQDPVDYDGYSYQDPDIRGFSVTHFDGAGIPIAGDLPFMPTTGAVSTSDPLNHASPYDHGSEVAQPGYYAVTLARYGIRTELTGSVRAAMMRFTFPRTARANVLAEVSQSIAKQDPGSVSIIGDRTLEGWVRSDVGYRLYFAARFDRPFTRWGTWLGKALSGGSRQSAGNPVGAFVGFDTRRDPVVTMQVGISYVDEAGAERNLDVELPASTTFGLARHDARAAWDRRLADIDVQGGGASDRQTFYDNLYRALLMPSVFDDSDGRYVGFDGQVRQVADGHHHYSALSLWDTYRSQTPLLELIEPGVMHDVLVSLLDDADQNRGVIPRWVQANIDRGIMGGDSGSATLADGATAGLLDPADAQRALTDLLHQADTLPPVWPREHLEAYLKYGYVPYDIDGIGASLTLEYAIDDYAVAQLARGLGDDGDAQALTARAASWRRLLDPHNGFLRPRNRDGSWANPTQPSDPTGITGATAPLRLPYSPDFQDGYQEGTGWQYLWSVPQDVAGLATAIGGTAVARSRLDQFFSAALQSPVLPVIPVAQQYASFFGIYYIGDQYTPANEPDLWAPWYYDWLGEPWKAQRVARSEMGVYNPRPDGMPGNDDTGEMSAWYVLAALGLYHAAPGVDAWELSSPAFPRIQVGFGSHQLTIAAPGSSPLSPYVHALRRDGRPLQQTFLTTCQLRDSSTLDFELGPNPDRSWGVSRAAAPPSESAPSASVDGCAQQLASAG